MVVPGVIIEPMRREDLPDVLAIEVASFSLSWTAEMFTSELAAGGPGATLVARPAASGAASGAVGYVCVWVVSDELHINNLAVHPRWRRRGVARDLVRVALAHGNRTGAHIALLEVRVSNIAAQRLYREFDFKPVGVRRRYYTHPVEDAVIMRRAGR